ncbi:unknown [Acholeplasma sp. CAG:878]|nr:unknown [Acholeplasma sp. CAG:878]
MEVAQSTTGNIYGVYDMSGGAWERVMGNMKNSSNTFYSSNTGFTTALDAKYYDSYKYDSSSNKTHARGKLGDATKETLATFGNTSGGWYSDYAYFPNSSVSWFSRGGSYGNGTNAGVFNFYSSNGDVYGNGSARAVLSAP